jgi:chromate reductase, NAD(P)H dehydrogenase (quinone)
MTRTLLISGSTHERAVQTAALRTAGRLAPADTTATLYDGLRDLPAFVPGEPTTPEAVAQLRQQVAAADVLLFSTPEYAGSMPGTLKNLLDWLIAGGDLHDKPAAWLSVAAPGQDAGAHTTLETALSHGNARILHWACTRVPLSPGAVDDQGMVADPQLHLALADMLQAFGRFLAAPKPRQAPSWDTYSSVYPVVLRKDPPPSYDNWRASA